MKSASIVNRKSLKLINLPVGFTVPEWAILNPAGRNKRQLAYDLQRGGRWLRPNGLPGAYRHGRDWFFYPDAVYHKPPAQGGPGRPLGVKNKAAHQLERRGYPRTRVGKLVSRRVKKK